LTRIKEKQFEHGHQTLNLRNTGNSENSKVGLFIIKEKQLEHKPNTLNSRYSENSENSKVG
jgi:hypothetical protein